jgi:hypothetical protein
VSLTDCTDFDAAQGPALAWRLAEVAAPIGGTLADAVHSLAVLAADVARDYSGAVPVELAGWPGLEHRARAVLVFALATRGMFESTGKRGDRPMFEPLVNLEGWLREAAARLGVLAVATPHGGRQ